MGNYKELKDILRTEKKKIYNHLIEQKLLLDKLKKVKDIIDHIDKDKIENNHYDDLLKLKRYYPDLENEFKLLRDLINYDELINNHKIMGFNFDKFISDIEKCHKLYGIPPYQVISDIKKFADIVKNIKSGNIVSNDDMSLFLGNKKNVLQSSNLCYMFAVLLIKIIAEKLKAEEDEVLTQKTDELEDRIELIDRFNSKFTDNELLTTFDEYELEIFTQLISSLLEEDACKKIIEEIKKEIDKKEEKVIKISFDDLDMSKFTEEERAIIEELREICDDEDLKETGDDFSSINISYNDRLTTYNKASIISILSDVRNNLLHKIYENKEEIINIFKLAIRLYHKYSIRTIREERIKEFTRISNDFNSIVNFINKTYEDKSELFTIKSYIDSITKEYIPLLQELIEMDFNSDDFYDNNFDMIITKYKSIIKRWKKEMTAHYQTTEEEIDIKENTDNLVFCLNDDIDLSQEGYQSEFRGTVTALESKTSKELKSGAGRKGMTRVRKTTETNKQKDFIEYLENKMKRHFHFVVYRYSSDADYRTGLIKFEPSAKVKEFLEERYALSKQSACYGIFSIISAVRADHSEYSNFEDYILNNCMKIEEIALLFASDNPDYERLTAVVDQMLSIKKDMIKRINSQVNK